MIEVDAIVRKVGPKKWCLFSRKKNPKTGKRRNLGCYSSLAGVKKRERQVQFFKRSETMSPMLKSTKLVPYLDEIAHTLKTSDTKSYLQVKRAREVLATISKSELRKWLEMTPSEAKKLSDVKLYRILSVIIPEIAELSSKLEDLNYIFNMCGDKRIEPLAKKHKAKVLQFREILVGVIKAPNTNMHEVVRIIEQRFPRLRKKIAKIKQKQTRMITRIVKTTTDKVEAGEARSFPKAEPYTVLSSRVARLVKTAGIISSLLLLGKRIKGGIASVWEIVKKEFGELIDSLLGDIGESDGIIDDITNQLSSLI